jgi:beta-fructofuranosidase
MAFSRRTFLRSSAALVVTSTSAQRFLLANDSANDDLCRSLASDPLRPQYHLLPAHNWMNDPNGPIFYRDRYHMFYQYNPKAAVWGNMNWAHATSPDMLHWRHEPIALSPTPSGPDQDGVFSGSAVLDHGTPTVIYTGVAPPCSAADATLRDGAHAWRESQCLAVAQDEDLRTWKKQPDPVIATPPAGLDVTGFRDPVLWRVGDNWMLALGSGIRGKGGAILLYSSPDLLHWTYLHPFMEGPASGKNAINPVDTGDMWECPDFFPLGNMYVLLVSTMGKVHWKVGSYTDQRFIPEKEGVVDWGSYYAAKSMIDRDGNRILWGWIPETRSDAELVAAGWAGAMSLPRVLSLNSKGELQTEVSPSVSSLRTDHTRIGPEQRAATRQTLLNELRIRDLCAELEVDLFPKNDKFGLRLQSEEGDFITISYSNKDHAHQLQVNSITVPSSGSPGSPVRLHLFVDGSVIELFVDNTTAISARVYRKASGPLRLKLEEAELTSLDAWQIQPISNDRLTSPLCSS